MVMVVVVVTICSKGAHDDVALGQRD